MGVGPSSTPRPVIHPFAHTHKALLIRIAQTRFQSPQPGSAGEKHVASECHRLLDWLIVHVYSEQTALCGPSGNPLFMHILLEVLNQCILVGRVNAAQLQVLVDVLDVHFHLTLTGSTSGGLCWMRTIVRMEESDSTILEEIRPTLVFVEDGHPDRLFTELLSDIQDPPLVAVFARDLLNTIRV